MNRSRRARSILPVLASLASALLAAAPASAQNYRELPIGGRTATMGGAGTAAGNDSAMPYLNPAGLAGVPGDIFAISATVYSYTQRSFKNFLFPTGTPPGLGIQLGSESFATSSIGELPSSVMYFKQVGDPKAKVQHRIGISLVIPSARNVDIVASVNGRTNLGGTFVETASLNSLQRTYYIGPTYAVALNPDLRLGLSLYGVYRRDTISGSFSSSLSILGGAGSSSFQAQQSTVGEGFSIAPIAGVQARVVSDLWAGLGIAVPSLPLTGRYRRAGTSSGDDPNGSSFEQRSNGSTSTLDAKFESVTPLRLNVGAAWQRPTGFSAAADLQFYLGRTDSTIDGVSSNEDRRSGDLTRQYRQAVNTKTEANPIVDFSVGGEYALNKIIAARAGFFTDTSSSPKIGGVASDVRRIRLDRFGGTLGLGLKLGSFDTTTGVLLARGNGHYGASDPNNRGVIAPVEATETTGMLILSGAVTVEEAKRAIRTALPFETGPLPDLDLGSSANKTPAPWIPSPLPPEPKPAAPALRR